MTETLLNVLAFFWPAVGWMLAGMVYLTVGFFLLVLAADASSGYAKAINTLTGYNPISGAFWFYVWPLAFVLAFCIWLIRGIREAVREVQS